MRHFLLPGLIAAESKVLVSIPINLLRRLDAARLEKLPNPCGLFARLQRMEKRRDGAQEAFRSAKRAVRRLTSGGLRKMPRSGGSYPEDAPGVADRGRREPPEGHRIPERHEKREEEMLCPRFPCLPSVDRAARLPQAPLEASFIFKGVELPSGRSVMPAACRVTTICTCSQLIRQPWDPAISTPVYQPRASARMPRLELVCSERYSRTMRHVLAVARLMPFNCNTSSL